MLSAGLVLLLAIQSAAAAGRSCCLGLNMRMVGTGISRYRKLNIPVFIQTLYCACVLGFCVN